MESNSLWNQYLQKREKIKMKKDSNTAIYYCLECGKPMKKTIFKIGEFNSIRGWECKDCGDTTLHQNDASIALLINKLKHGKEIKLGELGGALIVRIPKEVVDLYHLKKGNNVTIKVRDANRIELEV